MGMNRCQTIALSVGADRIPIDQMDAGNIVAVAGLKDAMAGSTVSSDKAMEAFEKITHYSEPVVTVAIEAKHMKDLPKLVEVLRTVAKADPSIQVEINQETGEHLLSGMGELHLEITTYRIVNDHKVEIKSSPPIVVYREYVKEQEARSKASRRTSTTGSSSKSPAGGAHRRRHQDRRAQGRREDQGRQGTGQEAQDLGMDRDEARGVVMFKDNNVFIDMTKGIQYLNETIELCKQAFEEAMNVGPLAQEKCAGVKMKLVDAKLHEDSIHRGPAQVIPASRSAIYGAMCLGDRVLLEPLTKIYINVPSLMGDAYASSSRGGPPSRTSTRRAATRSSSPRRRWLRCSGSPAPSVARPRAAPCGPLRTPVSCPSRPNCRPRS